MRDTPLLEESDFPAITRRSSATLHVYITGLPMPSA